VITIWVKQIGVAMMCHVFPEAWRRVSYHECAGVAPIPNTLGCVSGQCGPLWWGMWSVQAPVSLALTTSVMLACVYTLAASQSLKL